MYGDNQTILGGGVHVLLGGLLAPKLRKWFEKFYYKPIAKK